MHRSFTSLLAALVLSAPATGAAARTHAASAPLRPPNGTYVYSMSDEDGHTAFRSTLVVNGRGTTFDISETTKLPNGQIATMRSTWSGNTLLPLRFEVHQGKVSLRATITPAAVKFIGMPIAFARIPGTGYVLPSVGLIANSLMLPYAVLAHPGESLTLAEIQNNQTVRIRPSGVPTSPQDPSGTIAIAVTKDKRHGDSADEERIITWINRKTGIMDEGRAYPGQARITLLRFTPSARG